MKSCLLYSNILFSDVIISDLCCVLNINGHMFVVFQA